MEFEPSEEQSKIYKFIKNGIGSAFIEAYAGCGKSTTLLGCLDNIKNDKSVLIIAHNVDIVNHLRRKIVETSSRDIKDWKMTNILTYHSLGYHILLENMDKLGLSELPKINERKYIKYINDNIVSLSDGCFEMMRKSRRAMYKSNITFLIGFCRHNINQNRSDIIKTINHFKLNIVFNEVDAVLRCMDWGKKNLNEIDFQDMLWLPYELHLHTKRYLADFLFVDEAQDTSMAQFELFRKCIKRNTRYVAVGDENQTINMWCGSDKDSFKKFGTIGNRVSRFTLTKSFRCGKAIIKHANKIVPEITADDSNCEGAVNYNISLNELSPGDMVLCRHCAPLMRLYLSLLKAGKKAYIVGEKHTYNSLYYYVKSLEADSVAELAFNAEKNLIDTWEETAASYGESLEDTASNELIVNLYDQVQTILSITSYCKTMEEVYDIILKSQINDVDKDNTAIKLSTIHRAKGLEKDRVFILKKSLIPSKFAKTEWELESEKNLEYVMITRAISSLNYLTEEGDEDKAMCSPLNMYSKLKSVRKNLHIE